jgi:hypothetical protein
LPPFAQTAATINQSCLSLLPWLPCRSTENLTLWVTILERVPKAVRHLHRSFSDCVRHVPRLLIRKPDLVPALILQGPHLDQREKAIVVEEIFTANAARRMLDFDCFGYNSAHLTLTPLLT